MMFILPQASWKLAATRTRHPTLPHLPCPSNLPPQPSWIRLRWRRLRHAVRCEAIMATINSEYFNHHEFSSKARQQHGRVLGAFAPWLKRKCARECFNTLYLLIFFSASYIDLRRSRPHSATPSSAPRRSARFALATRCASRCPRVARVRARAGARPMPARWAS